MACWRPSLRRSGLHRALRVSRRCRSQFENFWNGSGFLWAPDGTALFIVDPIDGRESVSNHLFALQHFVNQSESAQRVGERHQHVSRWHGERQQFGQAVGGPAGRLGCIGLGQNAASLSYGWPGVLQGCYSLLLQDENGQIHETDSISAGLDYPGVGPEHALLLAAGRVSYESATDDEALAALQECSRLEGILPALETAHALHGAKRWAARNPGKRVVICMSGRGDKDMPTLQRTILAEGGR